MDADGYVLLKRKEHPNCDRHGYVREHRLVMEDDLGRLLDRDEVVHHKDGDKQNNHIDNLQLYPSNGAHLRDTLKGKMPYFSDEGLERVPAGIRRAAKRQRAGSPGE